MERHHTPRGRVQDRTKVAGAQEHEVRYEAQKTGRTTEDIKGAVRSVGNSRAKVEDRLNKR